MKWIFMLLVAAFLVLKALPEVEVLVSGNADQAPAVDLASGERNVPRQIQATSRTEIAPRSKYSCDGRQYCSQMSSCEEASFFLHNCPGVKMDGDNDGVPCEEQWCR